MCSTTIHLVPRPDRHRAELVAATVQLLRRQGYSATRLTEFLQAADATNGSLYHHFPGGKEELARAAIDVVAGQVKTALQDTLDATDDIALATQTWIDGPIAALDADPRDGCPVAPTALGAASISEPLRTTAAAAFAGWSDAFERSLARSRDTSTAREQASVLLSAIEGALLLDRTAHSTTHLRALRAAVPALLSHAQPATGRN